MTNLNTNKTVSPLLKFGILFFPLLFSWFTLKAGYSTKTRIISFAWLALILLVGATEDDAAVAITGLIIIGGFVFLLFQFFSLILKQSKKRKEQLLAAINNEQAWSDYCINKKLTPFMQKTILSSYGIVRDPIHLPSKKTETSASKKFGSLKISYSSAENIDNEDEWKKYDSIEDWKADLTVFWAGKTDDIEFSYRKDYNSPKERKKVTPKELVFDGNKRIYIKGYCHQKQKDVHFNSEKIETKILAGSTRYDFEEWVERRLKVDVEDLSDKFGVWI